MSDIHGDCQSVLVSEGELKEICDRLAKQITLDYANSDRELIFVIVLKGSIMFAADLIRMISMPSVMEFMKVSSYGSGSESSGSIQVHLDLKRDVSGADVVILEDIVDSGRTLKRLTELLAERGANSVRCCTLLDKPDRRAVDFDPDYVGKIIPDVFVVGYGLDYDEKYRHLPYVGVLRPSVYQK